MERFFSERRKIYFDRLHSVIYDEANKGDIVFLGKGSQMLLISFGCALDVMVTGSLGNRIQAVIKEGHIDEEVAKKIIEQSNHNRAGFLRFAFDKNWLDPTLYDVIINTDKLNVESAVRMVVDASKSDEIKTCGIESVNILGKLALERKVESVLLETGLMCPHVATSVESTDTVRVYGLAHSANEKERIEEGYEFKEQGYDLDKVTVQISFELGRNPEQVWELDRHPITFKARCLLCYWAARKLRFSATGPIRTVCLNLNENL
jgi:hypothetical protein